MQQRKLLGKAAVIFGPTLALVSPLMMIQDIVSERRSAEPPPAAPAAAQV